MAFDNIKDVTFENLLELLRDGKLTQVSLAIGDNESTSMNVRNPRRAVLHIDSVFVYNKIVGIRLFKDLTDNMPCVFTYVYDQGFVGHSDKATKVEMEAAKFYFLSAPVNIIQDIKTFLYRLEDEFFEKGLKTEIWSFFE